MNDSSVPRRSPRRQRVFHERPQLEIEGDDIAFVYPQPKEALGDTLWQGVGISARWRNLLTAIPALGILLFLAVVLLTFSAAVPVGGDRNAAFILFILGCVFLALVPLAAWWTLYRFRHHDWFVHKTLDKQAIQLCVEDRRLIRRYASQREQVWPREQIENIAVERREETVSSGESQTTVVVSSMWVILRAGGKVHLFGSAAPGSLQEQDLHWMAGELRRALQVPYDAPPTPVTGASLEKTADGLTIRLASADPVTVWRGDVQAWLWVAVVLSGLLAICWVFLHIIAMCQDEVGSASWQQSLFLLVCIPITATIFCGIALGHFLNKTHHVQAIADRTLVALSLRSGTLYRTYRSGREESWPASDIVAVRVDRVKKSEQVRLHLAHGETVHLFGDLMVLDQNKLEREGLTWLALELARGLGLVVGEALGDGSKHTQAIKDLRSRS